MDSFGNPALVDSGADLMGYESQKKWKLSTSVSVAQCQHSRWLSSVHSKSFFSLATVFSVRGCFHLYQDPQHQLILGYPWLSEHNPHMNWSTGEVTTCGTQCNHSCFSHNRSAPVPPPSSPASVRCGDLASEAHYPDLSEVPTCYIELKEVFNKAQAISLPLHHIYDCDNDLLSSTTLPKLCFNSLCEENALTWLEDCTDSDLAVGIIPSWRSIFCFVLFFYGFVVELDASDLGIGVVHSQKSAKDNKLHPCTFLLWTEIWWWGWGITGHKHTCLLKSEDTGCKGLSS